MTKYTDFIDEMAIRTKDNIPKEEYSYEDEFNTNKDTLKLVRDNIDGKYRIYQSPSIYFLADKEDKYLGNLKLINPRNIKTSLSPLQVFVIQSSHSKLQEGGFYKKMFKALFDYTNYNVILSDLMMSGKAITSWENLLSTTSYIPCVFNEDTGKLEDYNSSKDYFEHDNMVYRLGIKKH